MNESSIRESPISQKRAFEPVRVSKLVAPMGILSGQMGLLHFLPIAIDLVPHPSLCTLIRTIEGAEIECPRQMKSSGFKSNPQRATVATSQRENSIISTHAELLGRDGLPQRRGRGMQSFRALLSHRGIL
jgi:hypothetical protein